MNSETSPEQPQQDPQIKMSFERALCPRHGEPLRKKWPSGFVQIILPLMQEWIGSEEAIAETGGKTENIESVFDKKPLCCRIDPNRLFRAYVDSGVGVIAKCEACERWRIGTPYSLIDRHGVMRQLKHVCFECVLFKMEPDK